MEYSRYQTDIFEFARQGSGHGSIHAGAGTGKTFTGVEMTRFIPSSGVGGKPKTVFLAFNKHIQEELARKLPEWVIAKTYHSFGLSAIPMREFKIDSNKNYKILKAQFGYENQSAFPTMSRLAGLLKGNLIPQVDVTPELINQYIDHYGIELGDDEDKFDDIAWGAKLLLDPVHCERLKMIDFDDMIWYPLVRNLPIPSQDYLLVDEFQDSNEAQMELVLRAKNHHGRIFAIGDPNQCQPAGTMITLTGGESIDIANVRPGMSVVSFDRHASAFVGMKSQGRKVLEVKKRPFTGELVTVQVGDRQTACTPNHKWMVRFNDRSTKYFATYLMQKGDSFRVGWCQLFTTEKSNHMAMRCRIEDADNAWILSVFDNREDASLEESYIAAYYGLPTVMFKANNTSYVYTQERLDSLFNRLNDTLLERQHLVLMSRAKAVLKDHHRMIEYPFYTKKDGERRGRTTIFVTEACNLIPEIMSLPLYCNQQRAEWESIQLGYHTTSNEFVYSLKIETHEMYVADGILTHNSIYHWRGAGTQGMEIFSQRTDATQLPLSISYRCPKSVVQLVNQKFPHIPYEAWDQAIEGSVNQTNEEKMFQTLLPGDMVLCRLNAPLVAPAMRLLRMGKKAIIRGRDIGKNLLQMIQKIERTYYPESIGEFLQVMQDYVEKEGAKLRAVERHSQADLLADKAETIFAFADGVDTVSDMKCNIEAIFSDDQEGITFSSGHRAKGLEAPNVYILHPELFPFKRAKTPEAKAQEINLHYVICTRPKISLNFVQG